jgi:hypothetical protein
MLLGRYDIQPYCYLIHPVSHNTISRVFRLSYPLINFKDIILIRRGRIVTNFVWRGLSSRALIKPSLHSIMNGLAHISNKMS